MTTQQDSNGSERVVFTATGATGTVLARFTRNGAHLGDLAGEWVTVQFDDGETIDVQASDLSPLDEAPAANDEQPMHTYTAQFVKAADADAFAERISSDPNAWRVTNVVHRTGRRTVTFDGPATREYRMDIAETVGFYGSPPLGRVATLDGNPTPRSY